MARRITTGILGGPVLGNLKATTNLITAAETNANITIEGNGTGIVEVDDVLELRSQNSIKLYDLDNSASINIKSPEAVTSTVDLTLPDNTPAQNQVLRASDANGNLSWSTIDITVAEESTSSSNLGLYFGAIGTTVSTTTLNHEAGTLYYQPSTGTLYSTTFNGAFDGDGSSLTDVIAGKTLATNSLVTDTNVYPLYFGEISSQLECVQKTGDFGNYTNNPTYQINTGELKATLVTATSDVTLKSDISTIEDALDKVKKLRGVQYKRKFNNREEIGLIAQECESIIPSLVTGEDGNKGVAYGNITALLIEAIKEQQAEIENLKRKLSV